MNRLIATVALLGILVITACSDDEPCLSTECSDPCSGSACDDMASDMTEGDVGDDGLNDDMGQDAQVDTGQDMNAPDMAADMMPDAQEDMDPVFPSPSASTLIDPSIPLIFRDADQLGGGMIAVGTTPNDFAPNESREAVAIHYDGTGVQWSARIGDASNDQFTAVARRGNQVLLGGVARGYSVGTTNNNDVFLVRATPAGFGEAFNWGTNGDELLYGLFDGGQVAAWIGVGEAGNGDNRDGLVVAFDANLQVLWATRFETGADEVFIDGAIAGNQVVVVGSTGVRSGTRRSLVAAVGDNTVTWARRGTADDTHATAAVAEGNRVFVAGNAASNSGFQPAIMRFAADGSVDGVRFDIGGSASNIKLGVQRHVVAAYGANNAGMLITWDGTNARRLPLESQLRAGFLPIPLATAGGQDRAVFQTPNDTFVDLPYSLTPEASCSGTMEVVNTNPISAGDFEAVTLTPTSLSLTGGLIANPRITTITATSQASVCQP